MVNYLEIMYLCITGSLLPKSANAWHVVPTLCTGFPRILHTWPKVDTTKYWQHSALHGKTETFQIKLNHNVFWGIKSIQYDFVGLLEMKEKKVSFLFRYTYTFEVSTCCSINLCLPSLPQICFPRNTYIDIFTETITIIHL